MAKSNISQEHASRSSAEISLITAKRAFAPLYQSSLNLLLNIEEYPNIMLTLTCCYCSPTHIPTNACTTVSSAEVKPNHVAYACDGSWEGGAAALLHQGCPVTVRDCQVVIATGVTELNVKCGEL